MEWIINNLPMLLSSGAILIVLFVLKRALDWAEWKGGADKDITSMKGALHEIKEDIRVIREHILNIFEKIGPSTTGNKSPIGLTDLGREISRVLDAGSWANTKSRELVTKLQGKSPYEIQGFCFEYVKRNEFNPSPELFQKAQGCAYQHGITIDQVFRVFAIELRDEILKHLGLTPPE